MNKLNFKLPVEGIKHSMGEKHLASVLQQVADKLHTFYGEEFKIGFFNGKSRRADFYIVKNGTIYLFEFDGIQHSKPIPDFGGEEAFKELRKRDRWENLKFGPTNKIRVIRYKVFSPTLAKADCLKAQKALIQFITPEQIIKDMQKADRCKYVQNSISYGRPRLKIAQDLDSCIFKWEKAHEAKFNCKLKDLTESEITAQVKTLQYDKEFWSNLELLERPDYVPHLYSTKRINPKSYTRANLRKYNLPIRPISQVTRQSDNKAKYIKDKCDVLIDDSWFNVKQALDYGMPALLITRPHNAHIKTPYRVNHLKYQEIAKKYYELF